MVGGAGGALGSCEGARELEEEVILIEENFELERELPRAGTLLPGVVVGTLDDREETRVVVREVLCTLEAFDCGRELLRSDAVLVKQVVDLVAVEVGDSVGTMGTWSVTGGGEAHASLEANVIVVIVVTSPSPYTAIVTHSLCVATTVFTAVLVDSGPVLCCEDSTVVPGGSTV
jgi:hypothetical protein